jgi:tripartite-type tricarboxylate transporter receptor subunit TctC
MAEVNVFSASHQRAGVSRGCSQFLAGVVCASVAAACTQTSAQSFPSRPIRIVIGFAAGSNSDSLARPMARRLSESVGQQVIIDNRPGASGNIAMEIVAKSPPDGYTLFSGPGSSVTTNPHMMDRMPIDVLRDLAPVVPLGQFSSVLVVHPSLPAKSVTELVALAKRKPGAISFASPGHGTGFHLATELFRIRAGVKLTHVPYASVSPMLSDLIGGRVDMMFFSVIVTAPHVKSGKLRALATTGTTRAEVMPDIPTVAEAGVPDYEYIGYHGIFAPGATSRDVIERLNNLIGKVLSLPDVREFYATQNVDALVMTPADFSAKIRAEYDKWGRIIKEAGIKTSS